MKTSLLKLCKTEEDKNEIKGLFIQSLRLRKVITSALEEKLQSNAAARIANEYSNASWGYEQADKNGYERALKEVISLIS